MPVTSAEKTSGQEEIVAQVGKIRTPSSSYEQEKLLGHRRLTSADQMVEGRGDASSVRQSHEQKF
jgi:hypothetical protein